MRACPLDLQTTHSADPALPRRVQTGCRHVRLRLALFHPQSTGDLFKRAHAVFPVAHKQALCEETRTGRLAQDTKSPARPLQGEAETDCLSQQGFGGFPGQ